VSVIKVLGPIVGAFVFALLPFRPGRPFHSLFDDVHVFGMAMAGEVDAWPKWGERKMDLVRQVVVVVVVVVAAAAAERTSSVAVRTVVEGHMPKAVGIHEDEASIALLFAGVLEMYWWTRNTIVNGLPA
jgi:hypothetical protein